MNEYIINKIDKMYSKFKLYEKKKIIEIMIYWR